MISNLFLDSFTGTLYGIALACNKTFCETNSLKNMMENILLRKFGKCNITAWIRMTQFSKYGLTLIALHNKHLVIINIFRPHIKYIFNCKFESSASFNRPLLLLIIKKSLSERCCQKVIFIFVLKECNFARKSTRDEGLLTYEVHLRTRITCMVL